MDTVDTRSASVPEDGEKIIEIQLERLRTFKNHPFKVRMDPEMIRLSASVEKYGIINPLIVRPIPDGVYEIISGHRRKAAAEKFGYRKVPVIIRVMSDDEAVINMVDSNLQRQQITFSEKAFAYKMIDADPQGSLTASLGYVEPDEIGTTLATIMMAIINEKEFEITDGILHHKENVDLLPANIELSALEVTMGNVMSRELIMKEYIETVRTEYDYILIPKEGRVPLLWRMPGSVYTLPGPAILYLSAIKYKNDPRRQKIAFKITIKVGKIGYVANSSYTVLGDSMSAGRIYDKIGKKAKAKVVLVTDHGTICSISKKSLLDNQKKVKKSEAEVEE